MTYIIFFLNLIIFLLKYNLKVFYNWNVDSIYVQSNKIDKKWKKYYLK